ncbi:MAG: polysaccharide biosynthesis tyrosine autokinase [Nanoarchaeota archaeon]
MDDEISFSEYYAIIKKNWLIVLLVTLLVYGGIIAYTFLSAPVFEATSLIIVEQQDTAVVLDQLRGQRLDIDTQIQIIRSMPILGAVERAVPYPFEVDIDAIQGSSVIEIVAESQSRRGAQLAANMIADRYINETLSQKREDAFSVSRVISDQIRTYQNELEDLNYLSLTMQDQKNRTAAEQIEYNALRQEIKAKEDLYNYLLARREEVGIVAQENSGAVRVIQYADIPISPVRPRILLNLGLGFFIALAAGFGMAFLLEYVRNTFQSVSEIEKRFGEVVMTSIPRLKRSTYKLVQHVDHSVAESIRMLRANFLFFIKDNDIRTVCVTSPQQGDGKTTTAYNLARSLTRNRIKVLLIDADLRSPKFEKLFVRKGQVKGLSDVILGSSKLGDAIVEHKVAGTDQKLAVLYGGSPSSNPSELIGSHKMHDICRGLKRSEYDVVLFDCPSLQYSETLHMVSEVDGVLLVVGYDKTSKAASEAALKALKKAKSRIVGVVVNYLK